jgi:hypothetical protein
MHCRKYNQTRILLLGTFDWNRTNNTAVSELRHTV